MLTSTSRLFVFFSNPTAVTSPMVKFSTIKYGTDDASFIIASIGSKYDFVSTFDVQVIRLTHV